MDSKSLLITLHLKQILRQVPDCKTFWCSTSNCDRSICHCLMEGDNNKGNNMVVLLKQFFYRNLVSWQRYFRGHSRIWQRQLLTWQCHALPLKFNSKSISKGVIAVVTFESVSSNIDNVLIFYVESHRFLFNTCILIQMHPLSIDRAIWICISHLENTLV